jgi:hypothetical protein
MCLVHIHRYSGHDFIAQYIAFLFLIYFMTYLELSLQHRMRRLLVEVGRMWREKSWPILRFTFYPVTCLD